MNLTKQINQSNYGGKEMKSYYIQVNNDMKPVKMELSDSEAITVMKVLRKLANGTNNDLLVGITDDSGNELYDNWTEWNNNFSK